MSLWKMKWKQSGNSVWISVCPLFIVTTVIIRIVIILYLLQTFVILTLPWQFLNHGHWFWTLWFFILRSHKKFSAWTHHTHLCTTYSSSLASDHLQGGHNPSEWWECWTETYQRCQYDQQHPQPPHTSMHWSVGIFMWVAMGVYKCMETVLYVCFVCMLLWSISFGQLKSWFS